ncbi:MAG: succinylglutamate desuccinylase/aspartoacylase family protein, partial [Candidatus Methanofastidiosia archaeon]
MVESSLPPEIQNLRLRYDELIRGVKSRSPKLKLKFYPCAPKNIPVVYSERGKENLMITAAFHGDEPSGTQACFEFIKFLSENELPYDFTLFPIVNTYGYLKNSRLNTNRKDLNRGFARVEEDEVVALVEEILDKRPKAVLDLHNTNFLTPYTKEGKGYLTTPPYDPAIELALEIKEHLYKRGFSDLIRENMKEKYFLAGIDERNYKKVSAGVFILERSNVNFSAFLVKLE